MCFSGAINILILIFSFTDLQEMRILVSPHIPIDKARSENNTASLSNMFGLDFCAHLPGERTSHGVFTRGHFALIRAKMHPRRHCWSMINDSNACPGNTRSANHQAIGKRQEGSLRDTDARRKVQNKGWASNARRVTLVLEESQALLAIWKKQEDRVKNLLSVHMRPLIILQRYMLISAV